MPIFRIRNTFRFLLGNLYDFDPQRDRISYSQLQGIDRWALHRLQKLIAKVREAYDRFEFYVVYHTIQNFCAVDMSALYFDILKIGFTPLPLNLWPGGLPRPSSTRF